jgi:hypothetical protein
MALQETPRQYTERLLGYVGDADALEIFAGTPARLRALVAGRRREDLARKPAPDRWSVAEIVTHLSDAEIVGAWRFRSVLAENGVPLQAYDQNAWAETFRYADADPAEALDMFEALRKTTVSLLRRVDRSRYDNYGMHAERGRESVAHLIRLFAGHDLNHLRQIEALLGAPAGAR